MANKRIDAEAVCPFYFAETGKGIRCEGLCSPTMLSVFPTESQKAAHEGRYCVSLEGYVCCPVFRAIMALKYQPEE